MGYDSGKVLFSGEHTGASSVAKTADAVDKYFNGEINATIAAAQPLRKRTNSRLSAKPSDITTDQKLQTLEKKGQQLAAWLNEPPKTPDRLVKTKGLDKNFLAAT